MTTSTIHQLNTLSNLVSELRFRADEQAKATHSNFNVFTTVLQAHDEVRLHTRFIHNLLNPQGTHDCGDMFLRLFFDVLEEAPDELNDHSYTVRKEASTSFGQIDLLLETEDYGIAIENKIHAGEQEKQLQRYSEYLKSKYPNKNLLIYLTLNGKEAGSHGGASYIRISYREHILSWLEKCLQATYSIIPINQVLLQYRHVVRQLTGKTIEHQAMKQISDHLIANPDLIRMREEFNEGVEEVKAQALDLLAEDLLTEIRKHHPAELRAGMTKNSFGADAHGSIRLAPTSGSFATTKYQIVIEHISKWNAIVVGIESKWNGVRLSPEETLLLSKLNDLLQKDSKENGTHKADPQKTWNGEFWPTGWNDLIQSWSVTDDIVVELLDNKKRVSFAEDLISKAMVHIKRLERLHEDAAKSLKS